MFKNYLKIAWRNVWHNKAFSFLNVLGLTLGMTVFLLIILYVRHESRFDKFHPGGDRIYRVAMANYNTGGELLFRSATTYPKVGRELPEDIAAVEKAARLYSLYGGAVVRYGEKIVREDRLFFTDAAFLELFGYPWVKGDKETALDHPNTAVLSEELAARLFPDDDPLGKSVKIANDIEVEITGVMQSVKESHLQFDILISYSTGVDVYGEYFDNSWGWYDFYTYVRLAEGITPEEVEAQFPEFTRKHGNSENASNRHRFFLQPLEDIYLESNLIQEAEVNGDSQTINFLLLLAFAVILIAWINYINLATAKALTRAREVGIRKSVGAQTYQLVFQFLMESLMLNLVAATFAILAADLLLPWLRYLSGSEVSLNLLMDSELWIIAVVALLIGSLVSGLYPAFVLTRYQPSLVLKGQFKNSSSGLFLRKGLVTFQFVASILLIAGTLVVYQQLAFMQAQSLGIDIQQKLVVRGPQVYQDSLYQSHLAAFRNELTSRAAISGVTASSEIPGNLIYWTNRISRMEDRDVFTQLYLMGVDEYFPELFGNELVAGRFFSPSFNEEKNLILNEKASRSLGYTDPEEIIGRQVLLGRDTMQVTGVLENYHHQGLHEDILPMAWRYLPETRVYYVINIQGSASEELPFIEASYKRHFQGNPFSYENLDDHFEGQYQSEKQFGQVFGSFSVVAVLIACLGLVGLSLFTAAQRTKEIGIRKILGASDTNILSILSREFLMLVILANVFAWPITWWLMEKWLGNFAYRIEMGPGILLQAGFLTLVIAFLAVFFQAIHAARKNPVNALRTE